MNQKNILVIDDEPEIREVLRSFLQRAGYVVHTAADGLEGLRIFEEQHRIDLVITDLLMPQQEGIETMIRLRNRYPNLPVIAISGGGRMTGTLDILQTASLLGAARTFSKPFHPQELVDAVRNLLA